MITEYICEKCKSRYMTADEATRCENWHLKAEKLIIDDLVYIYKTDRFPEFLTIFTKDGEEQVYKKFFSGEGDD